MKATLAGKHIPEKTVELAVASQGSVEVGSVSDRFGSGAMGTFGVDPAAARAFSIASHALAAEIDRKGSPLAHYRPTELAVLDEGSRPDTISYQATLEGRMVPITYVNIQVNTKTGAVSVQVPDATEGRGK